ncbi:MAG: YkvA family protein [Kofleriaceae bacterium]
MSKHIDTFKSWAETFRQDVEAFKAVIAAEDADLEARKLAAGALGYLVMRMDLIPDWSEGIGVIDDVMVLRACAQLVTVGHKVGALPADAEISLGRLTNQAEHITAFLGGPLYDKFKAYCAKLPDAVSRGRSPGQIVDDEAARTALYAEVEDELKKTVPIVVADPTDAELRLKAYLSHKLA